MKVTIEKIGETQTFGTDFTKREIIGVDNSNPQYPVPIKFEVTKDKCPELDKFSVGQEVDVDFNIRGNRWTNPKNEEVIFNSLQIWRIKASEGAHDITPEHDANEKLAEPDWLNADSEGGKGGAGNLPF